MTSHFPGASVPAGKWIRASAWAAVVHVVFQLTAVALSDERNGGWSVSTLGQAAVIAILGYGAFRRNIFALTILGLLGSWRALQLAGTILRLSNGTMEPPGGAVLFEMGVTIPIALLWIVGAVSAIRSRWMAA